MKNPLDAVVWQRFCFERHLPAPGLMHDNKELFQETS